MTQAYNTAPPKKSHTWLWVLLLSLLVLGLIIWLAVLVDNRQGEAADVPAGQPYIGVLKVIGTMTENSIYSSGISNQEIYDQEYYLDALESMAADENNAALLLYIDSPGGEVLAASDLADAVKAYKDATGRPVYAYGHNYAASGGYWLACAADQFYCNRYCTTGSIGVTYGTMLDFSGLLEKYGVKTNTLTSGDNKAMGSSYEPMSEEQKAIYLSIINEYYGYFIDWVSENRDMDPAQLKPLADGRIYTATQAVEKGLADQVGDYEQCLADLQKEVGTPSYTREFVPEKKTSIYDLLMIVGNSKEINSLLDLTPPTGALAYYSGN